MCIIVNIKGTNSKYFNFRSSTLVLKKLIPYFQMDFYLPRSFMAALKLEEIPNLIASGIFPSDCILAVLFYFIKTSTSYKKEQLEVFSY